MPKSNNLSGEPLLHEVYSKIVVEFKAQDAKKEKILSFIGKTLSDMDLKRTPRVKGVLNTLCDYKEFDIIEDGDMIRFIFDEDEEVTSSNKNKGGEKMKKYTPGVTSGEAKIAKAVLDKCDFKAVPTVKKDAFVVYLEKILPNISKKAKPNLVIKVMARGHYIKIEENSVSLDTEGEKYLSP